MLANKTTGLTKQLVSHVFDRIDRPLPEDVDITARLCILDWLAVTIAGADEPLAKMLLEEAMAQGGHPLSSIIGRVERFSPHLAAMVNAATADAMDFSDGNLAMRGHTTPAVIATAFALAESTGVNALRFVNAIVAGIEMECRVGLIVNPPRLRKGFHPTGSMATFGAAATAAVLLDLTEEQWAMAIGLAATQAAGLLASGGSMAKPFHSGKAALNGLLAARLAQRGFISNPQALEAPDGFLDTHAQGAYPNDVLAMDDRYLIMGTIFKSHAACQLTHSSIENMLLLKQYHGIGAGAIEHVELQVPRGYMSVCNIEEPKTALEAKFSLRGVAAMTLLGDDTRDVGAYSPERIQRVEITAMLRRINVVARDDISGGTSIAIVNTTDGREIKLTSDTYKPIDDMRLKEDVVVRKFHSLIQPILGVNGALALKEGVMNINPEDTIQQILNLI